MDIGREINIILLLSFLIYKTKIILLKGLFIYVLFVHLYKLLYNYKEYYKNTEKHIYIYLLLFIILLYSSYLLIFKNKPIYFMICFVLFRIITSQLSNYKELSPKINNNLNLFMSIILFVLYSMYNKYKYKNLFIMDSINHLLLFIGL